MNPEEKQTRDQRIKKIRSKIKTLPIMKAKVQALENKIQKLQKRKGIVESEFGDSQEEDIHSHQNKKMTAFLEKYVEGEKIGEGSDGIVKKCYNRTNNKLYAVKCMNMEEEQIVFLRDNFVAIECLEHQNIVRYKGIYLDTKKNQANLVMEYETMPPLSKAPSLTEDELKIIIRQLLDTLEYIHSKSLCHRDIKPSNILFNPDTKKIKLIDFGISRKVQIRKKRTLLLSITGTLYYRAPEILLGSGYDERVDTWAVGITLYKLITGKTPFQSVYLSETINNILEKKPEFDEEIWGKYSKEVKDLTIHLLNKKRQNRLTTKQAKRHFWFDDEEIDMDFLTKSDSFRFAHLTSRKSEQKKYSQDNMELWRNELTDGGNRQNIQHMREQLRRWTIKKNEESVVIEVEDQDITTPMTTKRKLF